MVEAPPKPSAPAACPLAELCDCLGVLCPGCAPPPNIDDDEPCWDCVPYCAAPEEEDDDPVQD